MRRLPVALPVLLVGALALGGCGGDGSEAASADETNAAGSDDGAGGGLPLTEDAPDVDISGLPSEQELRPGLLSPGQMEFGFEPAPPSESSNDFCDAEITEALGFALDDLPFADVTYTDDPDWGSTITETLGFVPKGMGPEIIPGMREALAQCSGDEVDGAIATVSETPIPALGDDSAAYEFEFTDPETGEAVDALAAYVTRGDLMVEVAAYNDDDTDTDRRRLIEDYLPMAVDKAAATLVDRLPTPKRLTTRWPAAEPGGGDIAYGLLNNEDVPAAWFDAWSVPDFASVVGGCVARIGAATRGMAQVDGAKGVSEKGPLVYEMLGRVGDHGPELMTTVRRVMSECDGTLVSGRPIEVSEVPIADVGTDAQAYRLRVHTSPIDAVDIAVAYILTQDLVLRLHTVYANGDPVALVHQYAPVAVDRTADIPS